MQAKRQNGYNTFSQAPDSLAVKASKRAQALRSGVLSNRNLARADALGAPMLSVGVWLHPQEEHDHGPQTTVP